MLALATGQIRLVMHNDSLRGALKAHFEVVRRHWAATAVFLAAAGGLLFLFKTAEAAAFGVLGYSIPALACQAVTQSATAGVCGWILASWVCFYKGREDGTACRHAATPRAQSGQGISRHTAAM